MQKSSNKQQDLSGLSVTGTKITLVKKSTVAYYQENVAKYITDKDDEDFSKSKDDYLTERAKLKPKIAERESKEEQNAQRGLNSSPVSAVEWYMLESHSENEEAKQRVKDALDTLLRYTRFGKLSEAQWHQLQVPIGLRNRLHTDLRKESMDDEVTCVGSRGGNPGQAIMLWWEGSGPLANSLGIASANRRCVQKTTGLNTYLQTTLYNGVLYINTHGCADVNGGLQGHDFDGCKDMLGLGIYIGSGKYKGASNVYTTCLQHIFANATPPTKIVFLACNSGAKRGTFAGGSQKCFLEKMKDVLAAQNKSLTIYAPKFSVHRGAGFAVGDYASTKLTYVGSKADARAKFQEAFDALLENSTYFLKLTVP